MYSRCPGCGISIYAEARSTYLEKRAHVDVIPQIRKAAGDHLPSSVVTILPHLSHLRPSAFVAWSERWERSTVLDNTVHAKSAAHVDLICVAPFHLSLVVRWGVSKYYSERRRNC